ncbi:MAG: hypothetical protein K2F55_01355, partial [Erysipelotrichaceae bacterium]|nr:hypothetical protein [Erysipelotrichaceae bacterium]
IVSDADAKPAVNEEVKQPKPAAKKPKPAVQKQEKEEKAVDKKSLENTNGEKDKQANMEDKQVVKRTHQTPISKEVVSLLDDVIDPDTIILNYKSSKATLASKEEKEGMDDQWQDEKNRN